MQTHLGRASRKVRARLYQMETRVEIRKGNTRINKLGQNLNLVRKPDPCREDAPRIWALLDGLEIFPMYGLPAADVVQQPVVKSAYTERGVWAIWPENVLDLRHRIWSGPTRSISSSHGQASHRMRPSSTPSPVGSNSASSNAIDGANADPFHYHQTRPCVSPTRVRT